MSIAAEHGFELTTSVGRLKDVSVAKLSPYDAVYIGDPYCPLGRDNILEKAGAVAEATAKLKDAGKKVYLATYVEPWTKDIARVHDLLGSAVEAGIDAVEVADLGVLRVVSKEFSSLPVHIGAFVNLFNSASAQVLKGFGATRLTPYPELTLPEIGEVASSGLELQIPVHGRVPLGYTEMCINRPAECAAGKPCGGTCYTGQKLRLDERYMTATGRITQGDRDLCMISHLGALVNAGYRHFRVEAMFERNDYRLSVGRIYRQQLQALVEAESRLKALNPAGLCNGFYFARPGEAYV